MPAGSQRGGGGVSLRRSVLVDAFNTLNGFLRRVFFCGPCTSLAWDARGSGGGLCTWTCAASLHQHPWLVLSKAEMAAFMFCLGSRWCLRLPDSFEITEVSIKCVRVYVCVSLRACRKVPYIACSLWSQNVHLHTRTHIYPLTHMPARHLVRSAAADAKPACSWQLACVSQCSATIQTDIHTNTHTNAYTVGVTWREWLGSALCFETRFLAVVAQKRRQVVVKSGTCSVSGPYLFRAAKWKHALTCYWHTRTHTQRHTMHLACCWKIRHTGIIGVITSFLKLALDKYSWHHICCLKTYFCLCSCFSPTAFLKTSHLFPNLAQGRWEVQVWHPGKV